MLRNFIYILLYLLVLLLPLYYFRFWIGAVPFTLVDVLISLIVLLWFVSKLLERFVGSSVTNGSEEHTQQLAKPFAVEKRKKQVSVQVEKRKANLIRSPKAAALIKSWLPIDPVITLLLISFLTSALIAVLISPVRLSALGDLRSFIIEPLVLGVILLDLFKVRRSGFTGLHGLLFSLLASAVWVSLFGIWQRLTGTNFVAPAEVAQGRITGPFHSPNFLGLYVGPILVFFVGYLFFEKIKILRLVAILGVLIMFIAILLTTSVGSNVGVASSIALLLFVLFFKGKSYYKKLFISLFMLGLTVYVALFAYGFYSIEDFTPNYRNVYPRPDKSTTVIRACLWEGTKHLLLSSPFLGVGLSGFEHVYPQFQTCDTEKFAYPHNLVLNFWTEMGLLGLLSYFSLTLYFLYKLLIQPTLERTAVAASITYWLAHAQVDVHYFKNDLSVLFWIFLVIGAIYLLQRSRADA